jgi:hypothetical protein
MEREMTVKIEYKNVQLARIKVSEYVTPCKTDHTIHYMARKAMCRVTGVMWDWKEPVDVRYVKNGDNTFFQYKLSDLFDEKTGKELHMYEGKR